LRRGLSIDRRRFDFPLKILVIAQLVWCDRHQLPASSCINARLMRRLRQQSLIKKNLQDVRTTA
jgi:hypothetical protein